MAAAACWEAVQNGIAYPDDWFPHSGQSNGPAERRAKAICRRCEIQRECLAWALLPRPGHLFDLSGIWGGATVKERMQMKKRQRMAI